MRGTNLSVSTIFRLKVLPAVYRDPCRPEIGFAESGGEECAMNGKINRRALLRRGGAGAVTFMLSRFGEEASPATNAMDDRSQSIVPPIPKALVFDTFGTVVDWRGSIIAEGTVWGNT